MNETVKKRRPVIFGRMPSRVAGGDILLRRSSLRDLCFVRKHLGNSLLSCSAFDAWWRLRRAFAFMYIIEISGQPAGILGVSRFQPGISAELSLVLFDESLRGRGYGKKVFSLSAGVLRARAWVRQLLVTVEPENHAALAFWESLGFRQVPAEGKYRVMSLDLMGN